MKKIVTISGIMLLIAVFAFPAFGRWGRGSHMMGYGGGGSGSCWQDDRSYGNLSQGQRKQLNQLDRKFSDEMVGLRNKIWSKSDELSKLLNSENPDHDKLKALQKEISDIRTKMDEMHLNYELEARKVTPEGSSVRGYGRGRMRGYGPHRWMGYGRGPGMMHGGRGPGMMSPQSGSGSQPLQPLNEGEATAILENYLKSTNNPNLKLGKIEEKETDYLAEIVTKDGSLVDKISVDKKSGAMRSVY